MNLTDKREFVADIEKQHGRRLRRFLAGRLRNAAADVSDLAQEVFLRLLRVNHHESIRSTEAYLFTIAFHVLHQHALRRSAMPETVDIAVLIDELETTSINGGPLETNGIDFDVSARFDTSFGGISPSLSATRVQKYKTADFPSTPFAERVGIANYNGTVPRWRATGSLSWNRGGVSLTGTAHYTGDYADATFNVANGGHVESQTLIDLQAAIDFEALMGRSSGLARGVVVRVGASNLFNEEPPYSDVLGNGFDSTQTSTRQRFVYVSLSKTF